MQTVNLMPQDYVRSERSKRRLIITGAAMLALVLALLGCGRLLDRWIGQRRDDNAFLERELSDFRRAKAELAAQSAKLQEMADKYAVFQTVNRNRRWASCLSQVAKAANNEIVLTHARIQAAPPAASESGAAKPAQPGLPAAPPASAPAVQDQNEPERLALLLEGYAVATTDVTRFISALNETGLFERIDFKGSQMAQINGTPLSRFELECPLRYESHPEQTPAVASAGGGR